MPSATRSIIADLSKAFCQRLTAFLETLAVLSEAKTIDVTAALAGGERPGAELMSGQVIARLIKSDLAEPVAGKSGTRPAYRLTEAGRLAAALIARNRKPPGREQIEYRIHRTKTASAKQGSAREASIISGRQAQRSRLSSMLLLPALSRRPHSAVLSAGTQAIPRAYT